MKDCTKQGNFKPEFGGAVSAQSFLNKQKTNYQPKPITFMNLLLLVVILLLLFGGGGFYFGGPVYGGSGLGLVLLICIIILLTGGFNRK